MRIENLDLKHIWHPCSQMKDYQDFPLLNIKSARGSHLILEDDKRIIDAISSWWCKSLGHNHPRLKKALFNQAEQYEHVIHANTCSEPLVRLSQKLCALTPHLNKVFYSGDGSCAIETALKMSIHSRVIAGELKRTKIIALENGYHGETLGALSVSDLGLYKKPYERHTLKVEFLRGIPYVSGQQDPLWKDSSQAWFQVKEQLDKINEQATAIVIEPLLQGAGGMKLYSADFLSRLGQYAKAHNIHLIVDEIMTGFYRTGKLLACEYANIEADFMCLSKGLTAGWLPMSAVLTRDAIYELFYDDYESGKSFLHSHTFNGNPLAAAIALEMFNILEDEKIASKAKQLSKDLLAGFLEVNEVTDKLENIRCLGGMVAGDLKCPPQQRLGYEVFKAATQRGALLRPLGNTLYWLPPLNTSSETIEDLSDITIKAIQSCSA